MDKELKTYFDRQFKKFATKDDLLTTERRLNKEIMVMQKDISELKVRTTLNKVELTGLRIKMSEVKADLDETITKIGDRLDTKIDDLGAVIDATIAQPLERLRQEYPRTQDVKRIEKVLHMID